MTLADFLDRLTSIIEEAGVAYMLTGSLAAAYYAEPRATRVVDRVIAASPGQLEGLVNRLDREHIERWVDELGLDREWTRLVEELDPREAEQVRPRSRAGDRPDAAAATEEPPIARRLLPRSALSDTPLRESAGAPGFVGFHRERPGVGRVSGVLTAASSSRRPRFEGGCGSHALGTGDATLRRLLAQSSRSSSEPSRPPSAPNISCSRSARHPATPSVRAVSGRTNPTIAVRRPSSAACSVV